MKRRIAHALAILAFAQLACAQNPQPSVAKTTDWTEVKADVPKGKVEAFSIKDGQYGKDRKIWIYLPDGYSDRSTAGYPLIVSFDGQDYINDIPAPAVLDNLIAAKKIEPTLQVFVDNSEDRLGDLANHQKFADFVAKDLMPWLRQKYRVTSESAKLTLLGYSAGGLGAAYVAYRYPGVFGNVLSQSGAFWRGNEGSSSDFEWLTSQFERSPKLPVRFYLVVGGAETTKNFSGRSMVETSRHLRDVLLARGYEVGYLEFPGGEHKPESWRAELADGLIYLQGKH